MIYHIVRNGTNKRLLEFAVYQDTQKPMQSVAKQVTLLLILQRRH